MELVNSHHYLRYFILLVIDVWTELIQSNTIKCRIDFISHLSFIDRCIYSSPNVSAHITDWRPHRNDRHPFRSSCSKQTSTQRHCHVKLIYTKLLRIPSRWSHGDDEGVRSTAPKIIRNWSSFFLFLSQLWDLTENVVATPSANENIIKRNNNM